MIRYR